MKIGLNATCFNTRPSGAKQRFTGLYGTLFKRMPESQFVVYEPVDCSLQSWFPAYPNVTFISTPIPSQGRLKKLFWGGLYWRRELRKQNFDVFERFNLPLAKADNALNLLTVHDVRALLSHNGAFKRLVSKTFLNWTVNKADFVITVSNTMGNSLKKHFPRSKIKVIRNGLSDIGHNSTFSQQRTNENLNFETNRLLAVGHFEPRKNYPNLIIAISLLVKDGMQLKLSIVGNDSGQMDHVRYLIKELRLERNIEIFENLSDKDLLLKYQESTLFVFPSIYEGFGIPLIEAMNYGCPVISSDLDVFNELTENKTPVFDPLNPINIAEQISKTLNDKERLMKLRSYGFERAAYYDYRVIAEELLELYKSR